MATNSKGFHSRELAARREKGAVRIALLGDSFVEALHVPRDRHASVILEGLLSALDPERTFEVRSFGASGNGTYRNLQYAANYAAAWEPDLYVDMFFLGNDLSNDALRQLHEIRLDESGSFTEDKIATPASRLPPKIRRMARLSAFARLLNRAYQRAIEMTVRARIGGDPRVPIDRLVYLEPQPSTVRSAWEKERELLRAFQRFVEKRGARFLVVGIAEAPAIHRELERGFFPLDLPHDFLRPENELERVTRELGVPYLNLGDWFRRRAAQSATKTYWDCDLHWNETAHAWAAEGLALLLREEPDLMGLSTR